MRHPKPHAPDEQAPPPSNGAHAEHVTLRRPATHWDEQPAAHLIVEAGEDAGTAIALGPRPLRAGTDPDCDVVLPYQDACRWVEARLWPNGGRYILHALGDAPVRVNGQPAIWAVLEDGDVVELAGVALRFTHDAPAPDLLR